VEGGTATFSALIRSGVASTYAWDFGGACEPNGSNQASPTVKFNDLTGSSDTIFPGSLIVSNNYEATEFLFNIVVAPKADVEAGSQGVPLT
jgi:hypothetical protein